MDYQVSAHPTATDHMPNDAGANTTSGRFTPKRSTRIKLIVILLVALAAAGGFATTYLVNAQNFVTTDNAQVDGDKIMLNAPTSGTLANWIATQGSVLHKDQIIGRVKIQGAFVQPFMNIRAPADGTVAVNSGTPGTFVATGTLLAVAYNLHKLYVTARIDEGEIKAVHLDQVVDILWTLIRMCK